MLDDAVPGVVSMRLLAVAATVLGLGGAAGAAAQAMPQLSLGASPSLRNAPFVSPGFVEQSDPIGKLLARNGDVVRWRTSQAPWLPARNGRAVTSLRISTGAARPAPGTAPTALERANFGASDYEVALVRDWPGALDMDAGRFNLHVSPHAGFGVGTAGGSAEAGATVRLGQRLDDAVASRLDDMGVRDGSRFGDEGRWYLFAAASGRAVGLNMMHDDDGWARKGWSTDPAAAMIADAQVGVGWRRGAMQTSFGYVRREVKGSHMIWGQQTRADSLVALSFSVRPKQ